MWVTYLVIHDAFRRLIAGKLRETALRVSTAKKESGVVSSLVGVNDVGAFWGGSSRTLVPFRLKGLLNLVDIQVSGQPRTSVLAESYRLYVKRSMQILMILHDRDSCSSVGQNHDLNSLVLVMSSLQLS